VDRVKKWWTNYHFQGSLSYILVRKLKALKIDLRVRNEEVFDNVERNKKLLLDDLWVLEGLEEERVLTYEKMRKVTMSNDLERITLLKELSWR
jgi:hypothetical protein